MPRTIQLAASLPASPTGCSTTGASVEALARLAVLAVACLGVGPAGPFRLALSPGNETTAAVTDWLVRQRSASLCRGGAAGKAALRHGQLHGRGAGRLFVELLGLRGQELVVLCPWTTRLAACGSATPSIP